MASLVWSPSTTELLFCKQGWALSRRAAGWPSDTPLDDVRAQRNGSFTVILWPADCRGRCAPDVPACPPPEHLVQGPADLRSIRSQGEAPLIGASLAPYPHAVVPSEAKDLVVVLSEASALERSEGKALLLRRRTKTAQNALQRNSYSRALDDDGSPIFWRESICGVSTRARPGGDSPRRGLAPRPQSRTRAITAPARA